jgi:diguanylate cyclase (GGDEF)-like protein
MRTDGMPQRWTPLSYTQPGEVETVLMGCAPVVAPGGAPVGALCLFDTARRPLAINAAQRLSDLAGLISEWPDPPPVVSPDAQARDIAAIPTTLNSAGANAALHAAVQAPFGPMAPDIRARFLAGSIEPQPSHSVAWPGEVRDSSAWAERERQIDHMAQHDGLTGLVNRDRFHACLTERLDRLERDSVTFALLYLDLDRLAVINETLGHRAGDAVLVEVADRLRAALREEDVVGRIGGDEFAILQIGAASQPASSAALAQRLIDAVTGPAWILGNLVEIGLSIGIVVAPTDGQDSQLILKRAALALGRAKADGRNTRRYYEPVMDAAAEARRNLEIDLRGALSRGEFEIYYQPLVEAQTGRPTGAEALVRWRHPRNGLVSPADFIALAEETGFIVQLGEWVLRQACRDAAEWPADLRIAVNISAVQFRQARFVEVVMHVLAETGLPPERLELEITETVLMKSLPPVVEALHLLRRLGVRISLDDFGTGYSSLSYLRTFPFDKLKIDQSFVQDLGDPATVSILQAMIALGHGLGMSVTAEGVETEAQRTAVLGFGCTHLQGYLFGRPRSKDDFVREHLSGRNQRAD